ncbi:MAG: O-antigen ligase family protein [Elusimicrobia bacterium]|nr:O-antigen ligase family protein [Elusimicrobiota bacterium]
MRPRIPSSAVAGLLYALTAFGPFAFGGVEPWSRAAIEVLALTLALACFLKGRPAASRAGAWFWLFPAAVAALGCLQLAAAAAPGAPRPLRPFTAAPYETRACVLLWAAYAAVLWSVPRVIVTPDAARRYARFLFGVGLALACLGLLQTAAGAGALYGLRSAGRADFFGSYYNRDHAANMLLMSLGVGAGMFLSRPRSLLAGALLAVFLGLAVCASEASFLAAALAAAAAAFLGADFAPSPGQRRLRAAEALAGAALTVYFTYRHVVAGFDAGGRIPGPVMSRLLMYGDAWRWWRDAPLFGTGLGGFETIYPSYQDLGLVGTAAHAHSDWIEFTLETGLFGLAGALLAAGLAAYFAARTWREARSGEMRALIGGGLAAAAAFAAHSLFEFSFQIPGNAIMFFAILGFLLSAPSWADKSSSPAAARAPSAGAVLLAAGAFLALARAAILPAAAAWRAGSPSANRVERVAALTRAVSLDADPRFDALLSAAARAAAGEGPRTDYSRLRLSLRCALAAVERRPFDSDALYLAGAALRRLERPADSRDFFERTAAVRFAASEPRVEAGARREEEELEALRALTAALESREAR